MRKLVLLSALVALTVAACARAERREEPEAGEERPPVALEGKVNDHGTAQLRGDELELEADDFYFEPTYIEAEPSAGVTVEVENEGKATHTFTVDSLQIDQEVGAGEKKEIAVKLPSSGTVNFYCRFHRGQGMQGAFFFGG